jgi:hypothetical protein
VFTRNGRIRGTKERSEPQTGPSTTQSDRRREWLEAHREFLVRGQPVTDCRLETVVDLKHIERPIIGSFKICCDVILRHVVEVVIPTAPTNLMTGRDARVPS